MPHRLLRLGSMHCHAVIAAALLSASSAASGAAAEPARLPARLVSCTLGHATNFNPEQQQTLDDITYDTHHHLSLYLPAVAARTTPPPDAIEEADAVDPRTGVIDDPDGITADAPGAFERVVDLWPDRVELAKSTPTGRFKTILVSDYDAARGTARMFVGTAGDLTSYDLKRIYMGECAVAINPPTSRKPH
jgi:hypothetical protein